MGKIGGGGSGKNREEKWGKKKEIYLNFQAICAKAYSTGNKGQEIA